MSNPEIMWPKPFAWNAANKNTIQEERQLTQDEQDATIKDGFPLVTMTPKEAGGIAPNGQDMNGIAYAISANMVHRQKGLRIQFDPSYAAKIGGYDQGCILASSDYTRDYISLIPNNLTDPNGSGTAGRWAIYSGAGSIASATASIAGIVKIADSLNSDATDTALTANQGKVLSGRTQPATTTNAGISRFATAAEVANKANVMAAVTPKGVSDMFISTNHSETLPSGRIIKWGTVSYSGGLQTFNFNEEFPNSILILVIGSGKQINDGIEVMNYTDYTKTGFSAYASALTQYTYFAIGY